MGEALAFATLSPRSTLCPATPRAEASNCFIYFAIPSRLLGATNAIRPPMDCQHCGKKVSLLRALTNSEYCCEEHRWKHLKELNRLGLELLLRQPSAPKQSTLPRELSLGSDRAQVGNAGSSDSTESPCFGIGARVIQPRLIL